MKTKITFLLCVCVLMSLCVMGYSQGISRPKCDFCGQLKVNCPHRGEHPCDKCRKKFSSKAQMATHMKSAHSAPKPTFNCDKCEQKFDTKALLNAHKAKAHPAPTFNCNQCGQKFNTQAQLDAHKANVHTFKCDKCEQKFDIQALLEAHKTKAHPQLYYDRSSNSIVFGNNRYKMVEVSGGSFMMGATSEQGSDAYNHEMPVHKVTLSDYYIGQTEVTQALWQTVMESNPSYSKGDNLPVEQVSWNDCQTFIEKLNSMTGQRFRLPTEAEWEFAARGGNNSRGYKYSGSNYIDDVAWYKDNSNSKTHTVATKQANELGIYDMNGNVWEWCSDWFDSNYYKNSDSNDPCGAYTGSDRMYRGGDFGNGARSCRVSHRYFAAPGHCGSGIGLRLVLAPKITFKCDKCDQKFYTPSLLNAHIAKEHALNPQTAVSSKPTTGYENGYEYVDLGLSVKWAAYNVGASKPENYGNYFAWGEIRPKSDYSWSTYFDSVDESNSNFKKYAKNKNTTLDLSDDAAHANWGGNWRMPTKAEQNELCEKCTLTWTTQNGVRGYKFTSKTNGNSIFLPKTFYHGYLDHNQFVGGGYWSSSLDVSRSSNYAYGFGDYLSSFCVGAEDRCVGRSVRAVCP